MAETNKLEKDIQREICEHLEKGGLFFWRQNTSPVIQKDKYGWRMRRMPKFAKKGIPDIVVLTNGCGVVFMEVKRQGCYLSADQKIFEKACKDRGIRYIVVRSVEDVILNGF